MTVYRDRVGLLSFHAMKSIIVDEAHSQRVSNRTNHFQDEFGFDNVTFTVGIMVDGSMFFPMYFVLTFALPLILITAAYAEILRVSRQRIR